MFLVQLGIFANLETFFSGVGVKQRALVTSAPVRRCGTAPRFRWRHRKRVGVCALRQRVQVNLRLNSPVLAAKAEAGVAMSAAARRTRAAAVDAAPMGGSASSGDEPPAPAEHYSDSESDPLVFGNRPQARKSATAGRGRGRGQGRRGGRAQGSRGTFIRPFVNIVFTPKGFIYGL